MSFFDDDDLRRRDQDSVNTTRNYLKNVAKGSGPR
jgi:hypothetical protein